MDWLRTMFEEHGVILRVADCMGTYSRKVSAGKDVPQETAGELLDIVKNFADRCHHGKEESVLFPLLRKKALPDPGIIDTLLGEHGAGRRYIHDIKSDGREAVATNAMAYATLLPQHIARENRLFPLCDRLLDRAEKAMLEEEFERIERDVIGIGMHHKYLERVGGIEKALKAL